MQAQAINTTEVMASRVRQVIRDNSGNTDSICVRFHGIELDVWMDAQELAVAGGPYGWVEENCILEDGELELVTNHDYEIIDDEGGVVGEFCHYGSGWGTCDWLGLEEVFEAIDSGDVSEEILIAGIKLGIPVSSIQDAYYGEYSSDEEFAEELWESCGYLADMPAHAQGYIDWERVARDLMFDFNEQDGHYFSSNW